MKSTMSFMGTIAFIISVAFAANGNPSITGVTFSGSAGNYTLTINGTGFGVYPGSFPFSGDSSYFRIADAAQIGFGEWGYDGDAYGLTYDSWSDSQIVVSGFGGQPGDAIVLGVWNPNSGLGGTWGGNVSGGAAGIPQITSVTFSGSGQNLHIVIQGSGFGNSPVSMPFTGDLNYFIFDDARTQCGGGSTLFEAGTTAWGHRTDSVTLNYESWSDTEIVIDGFAGTYGQGCATVQDGDPVTIEIWNSSDTSQTGPQTAWGGFATTCQAALGNIDSSSWSGYLVGLQGESGEFQANAVTNVKGTWTVPELNSSMANRSGVFSTWIGIGGWKGYGGSGGDGAFVQIGISGYYNALGVPEYYAWYETPGLYLGQLRNPVIVFPNFPVNRGDIISAEISSLGNHQYQATIKNITQNFSSPPETLSSPANNAKTGEWIVEDSGGQPRGVEDVVLPLGGPLADFGTEQFNDCSVTFNNNPEPSSITSDCQVTAIAVTMMSNNGKITRAQPFDLSPDGTSFSVMWQHQ